MTTPWPAPTPTRTELPLVRWWRRLSWFNRLAFAAAMGYATFLVIQWQY